MKNRNKLYPLLKVGTFTIIVLIALGILLNFKSNNEQKEYNQALNELKALSNQNIVYIQNKTNGYFHMLEAIGLNADYKNINNPKNISLLEKEIKVDDLDFIVIGLVDAEGNLIQSDGFKENIKDDEYFDLVMSSEFYMHDYHGNLLFSHRQTDENGNIIGSIYGVIDTDSFAVRYSGAHSSYYVHIINKEGDFIYQDWETILGTNNIYEELIKVDSTMNINQMRENIIKKQSFSMIVGNGKVERLCYLHPFNEVGWYIIAVAPVEQIYKHTNEVNSMVTELLIKIIVLFIVLVGAYYVFYLLEKKKLDDLDEELNLKDEALRIALDEAHRAVFIYDLKKNTIEFLNDSVKKFGVPSFIENAYIFIKEISKADAINQQAFTYMREVHGNREKGFECELVIEYQKKKHYFQLYATNIYDKSSKPVNMVGFIEEITELKETKLQMLKGDQFKEHIIANSIGYLEIDLKENRILRGSENVISIKTSEFIRYDSVIEVYCRSRIPDRYREQVLTWFDRNYLMKSYQKGKRDLYVEYEVLNQHQLPIWSSCNFHFSVDPETNHVIVIEVFRNINDGKIKEMELMQRAEFDALTKIYNRGAGLEKIQQKIEKSKDQSNAFVLIDLDNFKEVNDCFGHSYGDFVLKNTAQIMKQHFRGEDVLCRLGGDEFVVFINNVPEEAIDRIIPAFLKKVNQVVSKNGKDIEISASIGVAMTPTDSTSYVELYNKADKALYEVKRNSKNAYMRYNDSLENKE